MNVLDGLVPLIDNGGTRSGRERRLNLKIRHIRERRRRRDRRSGADRRRLLNSRRTSGIERRAIFSKLKARH